MINLLVALWINLPTKFVDYFADKIVDYFADKFIDKFVNEFIINFGFEILLKCSFPSLRRRVSSRWPVIKYSINHLWFYSARVMTCCDVVGLLCRLKFKREAKNFTWTVIEIEIINRRKRQFRVCTYIAGLPSCDSKMFAW